MTKGKIAIIGCGLIGSSWSAIFSSAGYSVCVYDVGEDQICHGKQRIKANLEALHEQGLSRGLLSLKESLSLVSSTTSLAEALKDAIYAQESTVESVQLRLKLYKELDELAPPSCILASSSSTIPASQFTQELEHRDRCVIVHPVNPPLLIPLTEIVPAPWTRKDVVDKAYEIMMDVGQTPIRLKREALGFGVNRLQYALLAEAWRLVQDNILSPEDVDKVMSCGLAHRYAFYGPFEVIHMNAAGVEDYFRKYAEAMRAVIADFGPTPSFEEPQTLARLKKYLESGYPLATLASSTEQRDENLLKLAILKRKLKQD